MSPTKTNLTERNWLSAFLRSRENFQVVRCHCLTPMHPAEAVVPIWMCPNCHREVPRV